MNIIFFTFQGTTVWPQKHYSINGKINFIPTQFSSNLKIEIEEKFLSKFFTYYHHHSNHLLYLLSLHQRQQQQLKQVDLQTTEQKYFQREQTSSTNHQIEKFPALLKNHVQQFKYEKILLKQEQRFYFKSIDGNLSVDLTGAVDGNASR